MQKKADAAVAILRTRGPDPAILLMRRAEREGDAWSGHWSLPGGRWEESDADLMDTALRELEEECGIRLGRGDISAELSPMLARRRTGPFLLVAPFVFEVDAELPTILDTNEAVETVWIPQRRIVDPMEHFFQRAPGLPPEMWFPAIDLPEVPLWGFTYRLLVDWLKACRLDGEQPGFIVARRMLHVVLAEGLDLRSSWPTPKVNGAIPVEAVIDSFAVPGAYVAQANRVEVQQAYIRVHGLEFEEYLIEAVGD